MRNLNFYLNYFSPALHPLIKKHWYKWVQDEDGSPTFVLNEDLIPPEYREEIVGNKYGAMGIIAFCEGFKNGAKVISPSSENLKKFEEIRLTIDYEDLWLPFSALFVEFPQPYLDSLKERFTCPIPLGAVLYQNYDLKLLSFTFLMSKNIPSTITMMNDVDVKGSIEDHFSGLVNTTERKDEEEMAMVILLQRALVNYCLFLTNYGHKVLGYVDRKGRVDRKSGELVYIGMAQTLQEIYDRAPSEDKGGTHASPYPHWRKGHYRNQPHGPNSSLRKQIRIAPVFIRPDRFKGDLGTTSVEFK